MLPTLNYSQLLNQAELSLENRYNSLSKRQKASKVTCIKIRMIYHSIRVALYYDKYLGIENMILKLEYNQQVYLGNIHLGKYIQDLNTEPILCQQLLQGKNLKPFYLALIQQILTSQYSVTNFQKDQEFLNSLKLWKSNYSYKQGKQVQPQLFLRTFRRINMSNNMFTSLIKDNKIPYETVCMIKKSGYTVVRTSDPLKRGNLTALLEQHHIII